LQKPALNHSESARVKVDDWRHCGTTRELPFKSFWSRICRTTIARDSRRAGFGIPPQRPIARGPQAHANPRRWQTFGLWDLVLAPAAAATPAERGYAEALAMVRSCVDDVSA